MPRLSILIPVYNEARTILPLIERVKGVNLSIEKEICVCDDGSTDGTREILRSLQEGPDLKIEFLDTNVGRGGVIKHLWTRMTGNIVVHQDADLEYNPAEYESLLRPILSGEADVVYGSRFQGDIKKMRWVNELGNKTLSATCRLLYGLQITDLMTCYKMYLAQFIPSFLIQANGFDFEAELTARFAQRGARIAEVPIGFVGRSFEEGKKIRGFDALRVTRALLRCKLTKGE